ncbi:major facilitator superfamily protein [Striga asiatica]|uniref:Major facilitator superfamily protein n=1 Tax=Striga asiatica TaxID=4170 RepID=A0A5A7Q9R6_STRAF|nr:major facilitator superfamily protein [Striga asiatica]
MAYYGISSNLFIYLTKKLRQGTVESANNVTNWVGTVWMTPVLGAYVADAILGRYWTFLISSVIYLTGMSILTLSASIYPLKPSPCLDPSGVICKKATTLQVGVFFGALYTLAIGTGGTKPNISTIGADQFDEMNPKEKSHKLSFFNWWMFCIFFGTLISNTLLVYIQDNEGWTLGYGIPTVGLALSILIFLMGTPLYRHKLPSGSPLTKMAKVIIAAIRKRNVPIPTDATQLYEQDIQIYSQKGNYRIRSTPTLRFLNRACVRTDSSSMLCPVTHVEETKQMIQMIPILIATFVPTAMISQVTTLFVKQGTTLDRSIGGRHEIPPASLASFVTISMLVSVVLYDRILVRILRRWTGDPRGISLLQRMGIGMLIHIIIMVVATFTESHRRMRMRMRMGHEQEQVSVFILLPQFVLMGIADAFLEVAKIEFFYDQAPQGMKSLGTSYSMVSLGVGNYLSTFLLSIVSRFTKGDHEEGQAKDHLTSLDMRDRWLRDDWGCSYMPSNFAYLGRIYCHDSSLHFPPPKNQEHVGKDRALSKRKRKISRRRWYGHIHGVKSYVVGEVVCQQIEVGDNSEIDHGTEASSSLGRTTMVVGGSEQARRMRD